MTHHAGRTIFVVAVGLLVATFAYRWITDPEPRANRAVEERVVVESRRLLVSKIGLAAPDLVDPLAPRRKVGKVYVYPEGRGWAVSGYYRRDTMDRWHPYLMHLDSELKLVDLRLKDESVLHLGADDATLSVEK
jgi:hypothetical protein